MDCFLLAKHFKYFVSYCFQEEYTTTMNPMRRFYEFFALCSSSETFRWFHFNDNKLCLINIPTRTKFKLYTASHTFSKYMHGYMRFLIVKINVFPCILNGACIAVMAFTLLELTNSINACIISLPYDDLQNGIKLYDFIKYFNVLHTIQKLKSMYFIDILLFPVYKQYMYMYSRQYISCLHYNIIMPIMSGHRGRIAV